MTKYIKFLFISVVSLTVIYACGGGSSMKSGGDQTGEVQTVYETANYVGTDVCVTCHIPGNANFVNAYTKWSNSRHVNDNADPNHTCTSGPCHNPVDVDIDTKITLPVLDFATKLLTGYKTIDTAHNPIIGCEGCHGPGSMHATSPTTPVPMAYNESLKNGWSYQYSVCTTCHQLTDDSGNGLTSTTQHLVRNGATRIYRAITDTHFDNPDTTNVVEGYAIDPTDPKSCSKCHDPHYVKIDKETVPGDGYDVKDEASIYVQWARSGHAGDILTVKEDEWNASGKSADNLSFFDAGVTDATGAAWNHYDWDASNRQACQRCHTATGVKNFTADTANYNPANNDYSHLKGWANVDGTVTSSGQNELLYCWGCHIDTYGSLRTPGDFTIGLSNGASMTYTSDKMGKSSICYACHTGRETGESIKNSSADFTNVSFINSHYMAAGGIISSKVGFHYTDRNYDSNIKNTGAENDYRHDDLGVSTTGVDAADTYIAENGLTGAGQCIVCHFDSKDGSHTLSPVTTYSDTDTSLNPVCVTCHTSRGEGTNAKVVWLENSWKARFNAGLDALEYLLGQKGINFATNYPYFFNADSTPVKNWGSKETMGAAFNFNVLKHESGAIAHNRFYVRRLIYDSIDYVDDGVLNFSVYNTLNNISSDNAFKANAITLLINKGTDNVNIGTALERY